MSAEFSNGVGKEKAMKRQIGCMSGVLHFFNRRRLVAKRRLTGDSHNNLPLPPGSALSKDNNQIQSAPQIISECLLDTEAVRSNIRVGTVKDSINGETHSPLVKISPTAEEVKKDNLPKYRCDSPRPTLRADHNPSLQVMLPRNLSVVSRFSCDGREILQTKTIKIKELPRFSLDSSIRSSNLDSKRKEPDGSPNQRVPSVVAKLMGLAEIPNSEIWIKTDKSKGCDSFYEDSMKNRLHVVMANPLERTVSVDSHIERRVRELELRESNKEIRYRARKHIPDALQTKKNLSNAHTPHISTTRRTYESPTVVMKGMKSNNRWEEIEGLSGLRTVWTSDAASRKLAIGQAKEVTSPHKTRTPPPKQRSAGPQLPVREWNASPVKGSSPRVQKRKIELEKKLHLPPRRQQPMSPSGRNRLKPNQAQHVHDGEDANNGLRTSDGADETGRKQKNSARAAKEEVSVAEHEVVTSEQPSPVSVLDSSFYYDDMSPSPTNRNSSTPKPMEATMQLCEDSPSGLSTETETWELGKIKSLLRMLRQMSSTSNSESQEPVLDHVFEILITSDNMAKANPESLRRKLMLDVVQETLLQKLELVRHGPPLDLFTGAVQELSGKFLLRKLLAEIKRLENVKATPDKNLLPWELEEWEDFSRLEVPGLVVEIERLIFKDLIDEVVRGEANFKQRRRILFT